MSLQSVSVQSDFRQRESIPGPATEHRTVSEGKLRAKEMRGCKYSPAVIAGALQQLDEGRRAVDIGRELGISRHTIYSWKARYGGMAAEEQEKLREENEHLQRLVRELRMDRDTLWRRLRALDRKSTSD
jgi:putative transposase